MRAVVVTGAGSLDVRDQPEPVAGAGAALVAIETAGLCGTDSGIVAGKIVVDYPRVLGHELIGHVVRAGDAGEIVVGARVVINPSIACERCRQCRADRANLCSRGALMGRDVDGGFTEIVAVCEDRLIPIPHDYPVRAAASLQVLGTCVHAQRGVSVFPGMTAVVVGLGVSGFLMLQLLVARGVGVIGITRAEWKQALARSFGAIEVAPPDKAADLVREITGGAGADVVIEAVGTVATLSQAIELAALGGEVVAFGTIGASASAHLPYYELYRKELTIRNPRAALHRDYVRGVELATSGRLDLEPLATHDYPLSRAAEAFATLAGDSAALKVTLHP